MKFPWFKSKKDLQKEEDERRAKLGYAPRFSSSVDQTGYQWRNAELGIYFQSAPDDRAWQSITPQIADLMQDGFLEIDRKTSLDRHSDTNALGDETIDTICEVSDKYGQVANFNPAFIILVTHQYVDADRLMRQMYKSRWVAFMVSRSTFAPSPESYVDYINKRYFSK